MKKYKINLIYDNSDVTIDETVIKVLTKELKMICNKEYLDIIPKQTYLCLENGNKD